MRRTAFVAMVAACGSLAACSSSPSTPVAATSVNAPATTTSADTATSPVDDASSASASTSFPAGFAATGTATDSQGDTATVSISIGTPVSLTSLGVANVSACTSVGENLEYETDQWMATPVQVNVTLTSSLAVPVIVALDGSQEIDTSGVASNGNLPSWAEPAQGGEQSCPDTGITWTNVTPNQAVSWTGWLMDPQAITVNDPTGSAADSEIFLMPEVELSSSVANFTPNAGTSQNLVDCANETVIAVDTSLARSRGCTAYKGSN